MLVLVILAIVLVRNRDTDDTDIAGAVDSSTASWESSNDTARGISFKYPKNFGTTYVEPEDWPPQVAVIDGPLKCTEAGVETERAGKTVKRVVNGHTYCITTITEGAAGSLYKQYSYATEKNGQVAIFVFSTRQPQCANYSEPKKAECTTELSTWSPDSMIDAMFSTLELSEPTGVYNKG